jgi:hypothetical protein
VRDRTAFALAGFGFAVGALGALRALAQEAAEPILDATASSGAGLGPVEVAAAEMIALAAALRFAVVPLLRRTPLWTRAPEWAKPILVLLAAAVPAAIEGWATGKPPALALLLALGGAGGAMAAHQVSDGAREARG